MGNHLLGSGIAVLIAQEELTRGVKGVVLVELPDGGVGIKASFVLAPEGAAGFSGGTQPPRVVRVAEPKGGVPALEPVPRAGVEVLGFGCFGGATDGVGQL